MELSDSSISPPSNTKNSLQLPITYVCTLLFFYTFFFNFISCCFFHLFLSLFFVLHFPLSLFFSFLLFFILFCFLFLFLFLFVPLPSFLFFCLSSFCLVSPSDLFHIFLVVGQSPSISAVKFADSSRKVFSSASDTTVKLWDVGGNRMQLLHAFHQGASMPVTVLSTSKDGSFFVCGGLRSPSPLLSFISTPNSRRHNLYTPQAKSTSAIVLTTLHPVYCIAASPPHLNHNPLPQYHHCTTTAKHSNTTHHSATLASRNTKKFKC